MNEESTKINFSSAVPHIEWLVVFLTLLGSVFSMHARTDTLNCRFDQFMVAWHQESKDFHGRLEKNDSEFKMRITEIEKKSELKKKGGYTLVD